MIRKIKLFIGFLLLVCTCLPLGSCQKKPVLPLIAGETSSQEVKITPPEKKAYTSEATEKDYLIPITELDMNDFSSWLFFASFIWPVPFLIVTRKLQPTLRNKKMCGIVELTLSIFSAFVIYSFVFNLFYTPMFFGYIAFLLIIFYSLLTIIEISKLKKSYIQ